MAFYLAFYPASILTLFLTFWPSLWPFFLGDRPARVHSQSHAELAQGEGREEAEMTKSEEKLHLCSNLETLTWAGEQQAVLPRGPGNEESQGIKTALGNSDGIILR